MGTSSVSAESDISSTSRASSRNSDRSRSRSPIKKTTPKAKKPVVEKKKEKAKDDSVDTSQEKSNFFLLKHVNFIHFLLFFETNRKETMSIDSADDDALMSPPGR